MAKRYQYLFGPVPSRRLGRSLGVDLTPLKTCTLDCIFCQLGRTRNKTLERRAWVPVDVVLDELADWFDAGGRADYVTLSGSGEPTLHAEFGRALEAVRNHPIPSVLLTNGTLLHLPEVREAALNADVVKVSVSAWHDASFQWVNRPHPDLAFDGLVEGIRAFQGRFKGELWIEVFLVMGFNTAPADVQKIAAILRDIRPARIHLNTAVRPPAEDFAAPLPPDRMKELARLFDPPATVIAEAVINGGAAFQANEDVILAMLRRRPCTMHQIAQAFGMHVNEVSKYLGILMRRGLLTTFRNPAGVFYRASGADAPANG